MSQIRTMQVDRVLQRISIADQIFKDLRQLNCNSTSPPVSQFLFTNPLLIIMLANINILN